MEDFNPDHTAGRQDSHGGQGTGGVPANAHHTPIAILFGSNLGPAEGITTRLAPESTERGWDVTLGPLDGYAGKLPSPGAVIVVSRQLTKRRQPDPPGDAPSSGRFLEDVWGGS